MSLLTQVQDLFSRFELFRRQTAAINIFRLKKTRLMTHVRIKFNTWASECGLDFISRQNKMSKVPKILLRWKQRSLALGVLLVAVAVAVAVARRR